MRLVLGLALILLFLWLQKSQMSGNNIPCEAVSLRDSTVSLILSPLSLYSFMMSTLLRLVLSLPALVISVLHHAILLLMACPWCVASVSFSLVLTIMHVALYLLHLALVLGVVVIITLSMSRLAKKDIREENVSSVEVAGSRVGHQG